MASKCAVLPFLFEKSASAMVDALHDRMVANRRRRAGRPDSQAGLASQARLAG